MMNIFLKSTLVCALGITMFASCKHEPMPGPVDPNPGDTTINTTPIDTVNPSFANAILPIFMSNCSGCHNDALANDGYNFTTYDKIKAKKFVAGNLDQTKLYHAITDDGEADRMPPAPDPRLSAGKILLIKNWILNGAPNN